jgi:ATP-dependent Clp protease ATP-binding subunit ClpB
MTSNLGSEHLLNDLDKGKQEVMQLVKDTFKPEFLNRIDEIIIFNPLGFNVQIQIVEKMLKDLQHRLMDRDIKVLFDDDIKKYILKNGYSLEYGARPIKRFIQKELETFIATRIIEGFIKPHQAYTVSVENDQLTIK